MSLSLIFLILNLLLVVGMRIALDSRNIGASRAFSRQVSEYVRKNHRPKLSIILELSQKADTIIPVLDSLTARDSSDVEIVILIKHTAGKNARPQLNTYRRTQGLSNIKLVQHKSGMTMKQIVTKNATGKLVMRLNNDQRLSPDFYHRVRLAFLDEAVSVLELRKVTTIGNSIDSGLRAGIHNWRQLAKRLSSPISEKPTIQYGFVYRRAHLNFWQPVTTYDARVYYKTPGEDNLLQYAKHVARRFKHEQPQHILSSSLLAFIIVATYMGITFEDTYAIIWTLAVCVLLVIANQLALRGHTFIETISILLLAPAVLIVDFVITFYAFITHITERISRQNPRHLIQWLR